MPKELIAYAKAKPGAVTFGSPGNGTIGHPSLEMLKSMAKIDMLHIPYKGASRPD
jgi:tripartite-type tricarboxylate transporter receptor subunit TctC